MTEFCKCSAHVVIHNSEEFLTDFLFGLFYHQIHLFVGLDRFQKLPVSQIVIAFNFPVFNRILHLNLFDDPLQCFDFILRIIVHRHEDRANHLFDGTFILFRLTKPLDKSPFLQILIDPVNQIIAEGLVAHRINILINIIA